MTLIVCDYSTDIVCVLSSSQNHRLVIEISPNYHTHSDPLLVVSVDAYSHCSLHLLRLYFGRRAITLIPPLTSGVPKKVTKIIMCDKGEALRMTLPAPFDVLRVCVDKRHKGRRIITCIDGDWTLHVHLVPSGISFLHEDHYFKQTTSLIHIQCTNFQYSSVGYFSIGRFLRHPLYKWKKRKMFNLSTSCMTSHLGK